MLQLKNVVKNYVVGDTIVEALKGINLQFRKNDFVSVLGPSGCGKTTLLNIIGGLDRYTNGDLVINGVSTKEYKDVDWDIYRNNSIGFVFQNYNLIGHQTVLANVELAMTLAGISKEERRKRALESLEKVGLGDQINKRPNQLSGGQMQRVAIARALVNNPDILLADEPTGALDSETSIQIMEILKDIAKNRLVIMVTHNADLAEKYSTRIIRLLDGRTIDDTNPYKAAEEPTSKDKGKKKKISMSFFTALSLSFNNLLTKKTRTILTAFAGSIGIIGIALILSLSNGMQSYINGIERDTLSSYPIEIQSQSMDMSGMMATMMSTNNRDGIDHDLEEIYSNNIITDMISSMAQQMSKNDLKQFKEYLESAKGAEITELTNSIQYGYDLDLQIFKADTSEGIFQVNPSEVYSSLGMNMMQQGEMSSMMNYNVWEELLNKEEILYAQYDVITGSWPSSYDEVVLVVDENNEISDFVLYSLGLLDIKELEDFTQKMVKGESVDEINTERAQFSYEDILDLRFKLLLNTDYYEKEFGIWEDKSEDNAYMQTLLDDALEIKVVGIIRPSEESTVTSIGGSIGYTSALMNYIIEGVQESEIAKEQLADPEINVFTGMNFEIDKFLETLTREDVNEFVAAMPEAQRIQTQAMMANMSEEQIMAALKEQIRREAGEQTTYENNLHVLGIVDFDNPSSINLYPKDFESKEKISNLIKQYNIMQENAGHEEYTITYTDLVGVMISSVSSIINIISYVLIAFVSISLIVSSIMIGIITYISVLERTKEIGILRSIGASKKDISRLFNAETIIEGFVAGAIGIIFTLLLNIPINVILKSLVGVSSIASLPIYGGIGLILISMLLTFIAGLIPSKVAAKKDPVEALRTE